MSALATLLARQGCRVSGSDRTLGTPNLVRLEKAGVSVFPDDGSGVAGDVDELVYSTAVEPGHPDLEAAARLGIPVTHRATALAAALSGKKLVAIAGTCGKSSVTAMLGHILSRLSYDPVCVNGANVVGWNGAVLFGEGGYAVVEVDESDRSLTAFSPYATVITNSSADHYSKKEMDEVFDAFAARTSGPVLDLRTDKAQDPASYVERNIEAAVGMAVMLGCNKESALAALSDFRGVERRLENRGGTVYDDYAHNPEKLRSMISVLKKRHGGPVCVVWRPHGYGPLGKMLGPLSEMFSDSLCTGDRLVLLPVYDAGGTADRSVSSADLERLLPGGLAQSVDGYDGVLDALAGDVGRFSCIVTAGARDPELPALADAISKLQEASK